jgi:23S rRNA pseudouridine2605 synthase
MTDTNPHGEERLNKYLALQLGLSRREADTYIASGRIAINDTVAVLGARIRQGDVVSVDGKPLLASAELQYLMLNKPVGYVSSRRAQGELPTIFALLPKEYHSLKPVGRLDQNSSGLLLLTNDGDFAFRMTHPKFSKTKVYHVRLDHPLEPLHQQMISDFGVQLEDGISKFTVSRLDEPGSSKQTTYEITMSEGRNRQIRRTFKALGYTVTYLYRVQFGPFSLGGLKPGEFRRISDSGL